MCRPTRSSTISSPMSVRSSQVVGRTAPQVPFHDGRARPGHSRLIIDLRQARTRPAVNSRGRYRDAMSNLIAAGRPVVANRPTQRRLFACSLSRNSRGALRGASLMAQLVHRTPDFGRHRINVMRLPERGRRAAAGQCGGWNFAGHQQRDSRESDGKKSLMMRHCSNSPDRPIAERLCVRASAVDRMRRSLCGVTMAQALLARGRNMGGFWRAAPHQWLQRLRGIVAAEFI